MWCLGEEVSDTVAADWCRPLAYVQIGRDRGSRLQRRRDNSPGKNSELPKLNWLELLVARPDVDEEDIRCDDNGRKFSLEEVEEAKENFDRTMREKNPGLID
jgi:hypothetical protein